VDWEDRAKASKKRETPPLFRCHWQSQHNSGQNASVALSGPARICYFPRVIIGPMLRFASTLLSPCGRWNAATAEGNFFPAVPEVSFALAVCAERPDMAAPR
jgi:hypothetical protein